MMKYSEFEELNKRDQIDYLFAAYSNLKNKVENINKKNMICFDENSLQKLKEKVAYNAQMELLKNIVCDYREGNPPEHICLKYVKKFNSHNKSYTKGDDE